MPIKFDLEGYQKSMSERMGYDVPYHEAINAAFETTRHKAPDDDVFTWAKKAGVSDYMPRPPEEQPQATTQQQPQQGGVQAEPFAPMQSDVAPERGIFGDIVSRVARGGARATELAGHALQTLDPQGGFDVVRNIGQGVEEFAEGARERYDILKPDVSEVTGQEGAVKRGIMTGIESMGPSVTPLVAGGGAGFLVGGPIGAAIGAGLATLGLFGAGVYNQSKEEAIEQGLDPQKAHSYGLKQAMIEGGGETASNVLTMFILGPMGRAFTQPIKKTVGDLVKTTGSELVRRMAYTAAEEVPTEMIQEGLQALVDQKYGMGDMPWQEAVKEAVIPALTMSTLFGLGAQGIDVYNNRRLKRALQSDNPEVQQGAANAIEQRLQHEDRELAQAWKDYVQPRIDEGLPIPLEDNFVQFAKQKRQDEIRTPEEMAPFDPVDEFLANYGDQIEEEMPSDEEVEWARQEIRSLEHRRANLEKLNKGKQAPKVQPKIKAIDSQLQRLKALPLGRGQQEPFPMGPAPEGTGPTGTPTKIADEQRGNFLKRELFDQMKREGNFAGLGHEDAIQMMDELYQESYTDQLSGLPNRRAFDLAQQNRPSDAVASVDVDSLKWINDNMGHESGDKLLTVVSEVLNEQSDNVFAPFHVSGDEFIIQGESEEVIQQKLEQASKSLQDVVLEVKTPDGRTIRKQGVAFSYGTGQDIETAEGRLQQAKEEREARGERPGRGQRPKGVFETVPAGQQTPGVPQEEVQGELGLGQEYVPQETIYQRKQDAQAEANRLTKGGKQRKVQKVEGGWIVQPEAQAQPQGQEKPKKLGENENNQPVNEDEKGRFILEHVGKGKYEKKRPPRPVGPAGEKQANLSVEELFRRGKTEFLTKQELEQFQKPPDTEPDIDDARITFGKEIERKGASSTGDVDVKIVGDQSSGFEVQIIRKGKRAYFPATSKKSLKDAQSQAMVVFERANSGTLTDLFPSLYESEGPQQDQGQEPKAKSYKQGDRVVIPETGRHGEVTQATDMHTIEAFTGDKVRTYQILHVRTDNGAVVSIASDEVQAETEKPATEVVPDIFVSQTQRYVPPNQVRNLLNDYERRAGNYRRQAARRRKREYRLQDQRAASNYENMAEELRQDIRKWANKNPKAAQEHNLFKPEKAPQEPAEAGDLGVSISYHETTHAKKGHRLYVISLDERVPRDTYLSLNGKAKELGGYYSAYRGRGAVPGFQFMEKEQARKFAQLFTDMPSELKETAEAKPQEQPQQTPQPEPTKEPEKPAYGEQNTLVTKDKYEELKKRLDEKLNRLNVGFDPDILSIGVQMAAYHVEAGARTFKDFSQRMVADLGEKVKPYLKSFYKGARAMPGMEDLKRYMNTDGAVDEFDLDSLAQEEYTEGEGELQPEGETSDAATSQESQETLGGTQAEDGRGASEAGETGGSPSGGRGDSERGNNGDRGRTPETTPEPEDQGLLGEGADVDREQEGSGGDSASEVHPPSARERRDYRFPDEVKHALGRGGMVTRARGNIEAIKTLKKVEAERRPATPEEKATMAKYIGWGGMPNAFGYGNVGLLDLSQEDRSSYTQIRKELHELLTEEEYKAARASTQNAHYTSPEVIEKVWSAMERMGFNGGRVIEPGSGTSLFYGLMPEGLFNRTHYTGIERDAISGRIAAALQPNSNIKVQPYEQVALPDNFFDAAVSNVPFADVKPFDPSGRYKKYSFSLHDFFFAKSIDKVRPGGVVAFITSRFTMDKKDSLFRGYMNERAEFLGAIRLPNTAFKKFAGTEVTTDIIFLRKKAEGAKGEGLAWTESRKYLDTPEGNAWINEYFHKNEQMMLGKMALTGSMYGANEPTLEPGKEPLAESLDKAIAELPENALKPREKKAVNRERLAEQSVPAPDELKEGNFVAHDGTIAVKENGILVDSEVSKSNVPRVKQFIKVRDKLREVLRTQYQNASKDEIVKARKELNKVYDSFVKKYGPLNQKNNKNAFIDDVEAPKVLALEDYDPDTNTAEKAAVFSKRTVQKPEPVTFASDAQSALKVSLNENGEIDLEHMASISGIPEDRLVKELRDFIFKDPETEKWEPRDVYLSGNVKRKLAAAKEAATIDPEYQENVKALEKVQPEDLTATQIAPRLGSPWIPRETVAEFVNHILDITPLWREKGAEVLHDPTSAMWVVKIPDKHKNTVESTRTWGMPQSNAKAHKLIESLLNQQTPTIRVWDAEKKANVVDPGLTEAAADKQRKLKAEFERWAWEDVDRRENLLRIYNDTYNTDAERQYDGSHLTFPASNPQIELRDNQRNAAWRIIQEGRGLLHHVVGAGKTWTMVAAGMEMRRLGLAKKPMYVVPNHMVDQFSKEFLELYPTANILTIGPDQVKPEQRKTTASRIATGDWDGVIVRESAFVRIPVSPEYEKVFVEKQIEELEWAIREMEGQEGETMKGKSLVKRLEKIKDKKQARLQELSNRKSKDQQIVFEELGVDFMFVDEAHGFKNLEFNTKMQVAGLGQRYDVQKTLDMLMKVRYLQEMHGQDRGVVFATGTPISNSIAEMYLMMRYLIPSELNDKGISHFDAWAANFGDVEKEWEWAIDNSGYTERSRFRRFINIGDLAQLYRKFADVIMPEDLPDIKVPKIKGGKPDLVTIEPTQELIELNEWCSQALQAWKQKPTRENKDGNPLNITTLGRKAAVDMRLVDEAYGDNPNSKLNTAVQKVYDIWKRTGKDRLTQIVWLDIGVPGGSTINLYEDIRGKLKKMGIPKEEVAFISEYPKDEQKEILFKRMRLGQVRVLIGSTAKMGTGMNVQKRLIAAHHINPAWRPADLEQRDGRIVRQGNINDEVEIYRYSTERSFDTFFWQTLETKAGYIGQILKAGRNIRFAEDVDAVRADYAEAMAITSGDPLARDYIKADADRRKLRRLEMAHREDKYQSESKAKLIETNVLPELREKVSNQKKDVQKRKDVSGDNFTITINGETYEERKEANEKLQEIALNSKENVTGEKIGSFGGFDLYFQYTKLAYDHKYFLLRGKREYRTDDFAGDLAEEKSVDVITRLSNIVRNLGKWIEKDEELLAAREKEVKDLREHAKKPFDQAEELEKAEARFEQIESMIRARDQGGDASQSEDQDADYSRTDLYSIGSTAAEVQQTVDAAKQNWGNAPKINVVQAEEDLPWPVVADIRSKNAQGQIEGVIWNDEVYLVADNINSPEHAMRVMVHEVRGHWGVRGIMGKKADKILNAAYLNNTVHTRIRQLNKTYKFDLKTQGGRQRATAEALAKMAEEGVQSSALDRVIAAVRDWIRSVFPNLEMSDAEIRALIAGAERFVERGSAKTVTGPLFAIAPSGEYYEILPKEEIPQETQKAYKLMKVMPSRPGELFPLFARPEEGAAQSFLLGEWHRAERQPPRGLADRPGIHAVGVPAFPQGKGRKKGEQRVWVEFELPAMNNQTQAEADASPLLSNGMRVGLQRVPGVNEAYNYRTNPNAGTAAGAWPIAGSGKPVRVLTDQQISEVLKQADSESQIENSMTGVDSDFVKNFNVKRSEIKYSRFSADEVEGLGLQEDINALQEVENEILYSRRAKDPLFSKTGAGRPAELDELIDPGTHSVMESVKRSMANATSNWRTRALDRNFPIFQKLDNQLGIKEKDQTAYVLHRMLGNAHAILSTFLEHGKLMWEGKALTSKEHKNGFLPWFRALKEDGEKLLYWTAARRAEALEKEDRENWLTNDARDLIDNWVGEKPKNSDKSWQELSDELQEWNKNILDVAEQAGLISAEARKAWMKDFYIPFYRLFENEQTMEEVLKSPRKARQYISAQIKQLKGGEAKLGNPMENLLHNWSHLINESMRNVARERAFWYGQKVGIIEQISAKDLSKVVGAKRTKQWKVFRDGSEQASRVFAEKDAAEAYADKLQRQHKKPYFVAPSVTESVRFANRRDLQVLTYQQGGKPVHFKVNDAELFNAMSEANIEVIDNLFMRFFGGAKRALTYGATFGPGFRIANAMRDTLQTAVISRSFKPFVDTAIGAVKAWRQDADYVAVMAAGGGFGKGYVHGEDPKSAARYINRIVKKEGKGAKTRILSTPTKLLNFWDRIGEASEMAARVQLYANLRKQGKSHLAGAYEARDILDFINRGDAKTVQILIQTIPFINARAQGLYKLGRAYGEDPKSFLLKGSILTAASLALWFSYKDDERYQELETWDRMTYHHFWIGDKHYRIPKAFEVGALFASIPESMADVLNGNEETKYLVDVLGHTLHNTFAIGMPAALAPSFEVWANRSFFTGRPIEGLGDQRLPAGLRADPWTSDTLKALGEALDISPKRAEHWLRGHFATFGMFLMGVSDAGFNLFVDNPDKPSMTSNEIPGLGRFVRREGPARYTKYQTDVYEAFDEVTKTVAAARHYARSGNIEKARAIAERNPKALGFYKRGLNKVKTRLSELRKAQRNVWKSRDLTPDEKRLKIDELQKIKNDIFRTVYDNMDKWKD